MIPLECVRTVWLMLALAGCASDDEECGDTYTDVEVHQPDLNRSDYVDTSYGYGLWATAVGGTHRLRPDLTNDCGGMGAISSFTVTVADPAVLDADIDGDTIVVHAHAAGMTDVQIAPAEGHLWHGELSVQRIGVVHLAAREAGAPAAFLVGAPLATIIMMSTTGHPLIDDDLSVAGDVPVGDSPGEIVPAALAVGDHPLEIMSGGSSWPVTLTIVDDIDEIDAAQPAITTPGSPEVCFFAKRAGGLVAGVPWTFHVPDGARIEGRGRANCVLAFGRPGDAFTVTATALGKSASTLVTFQ